MALVEKIECTAGGVILFACTSVETPKIPPIHGKSRTEVKLQGWILEPLATSPPATKVTYIVQEEMKGWVPGFAKKSLARRPLVIATIDGYLQKKADRLRAQNRMAQQSSANTTIRKLGRRPSIMNMEPMPVYVLKWRLWALDRDVYWSPPCFIVIVALKDIIPRMHLKSKPPP